MKRKIIEKTSWKVAHYKLKSIYDKKELDNDVRLFVEKRRRTIITHLIHRLANAFQDCATSRIGSWLKKLSKSCKRQIDNKIVIVWHLKWLNVKGKN